MAITVDYATFQRWNVKVLSEWVGSAIVWQGTWRGTKCSTPDNTQSGSCYSWQIIGLLLSVLSYFESV